ncbi:MAG: TRAP transporter large permease [Desulfobacteraceae bacterium]|nr:TRAP transporter large permease [Desulfobacteraceae bacterium]
MSPETIGIVGIIALFILLAMRIYIGLAMMLIGFAGSYFIIGWQPSFDLLGMLPFDEAKSYTMSVIPLFILMGQFAFISGISTDIYKTVYNWMGHFRGGLAIATVLACAFFAAVSGSSLATGATMGMVAIPEMLKHNYDPRLATGCVAAGGTLGILIPPSIGFVVYGLLTEQSIGRLLMAGLLPGAMLCSLFILSIIILCVIKPEMGPPGPAVGLAEKIKSLSGTWGMLLLFFVVIGGIYTGIFTPTEAAGIGAFGALIIVILRKKLTWQGFVRCLSETGKMTAFIFLIIIGASVFSYFLALTGLPTTLSSYITGLPLPRELILFGIILIYVILGCVMEVYSIMMLTLPIIFPIVQTLGFDPIWFGVIMVLVLELGLITPPIGLNVYVLKGSAPDIPVETIFKGIWPFFLAAVLAIILISIFPQIALFIPSSM